MRNFISLLVMLFVVTGCDLQKLSDLEARLVVLEEARVQTEAKVEEVEKKTSKVTSDFFWHKLESSFEEVAYLPTGGEGYDMAKTREGLTLTFAIVDIQPFASGVKAKIRMGNPYAAELSNVHGKVEWGRMKEDTPDNENAKSREWSTTKDLKGNSWNHITLTLDGVPSDELGFIRFRDVSVSQMSMITQK